MAINKKFQCNTKEGGINVSFTIDFDGTNSSISNIALHSSKDYVTGLPMHPKLEYHEGEWQFSKQYQTSNNNEIKTVVEYFNNDLTKDIIAEIQKIQEENTPHFGK